MDELKSIWRECIKSDDQDGGIQQAEEKCMTSRSMSLQAAMMKLSAVHVGPFLCKMQVIRAFLCFSLIWLLK